MKRARTSDSLGVHLPDDPIDGIIARLVIPITQSVPIPIQILHGRQRLARPRRRGQTGSLGFDGHDGTRCETEGELFLTVVRDQVGFELARVFVV